MYIQPLRLASPPIIPRDRLESFIGDVFRNFAELHAQHRLLLDQLHEIQRAEHPTIWTIAVTIFDAALNFREAYLEYIHNYPIAAYCVDSELTNNPAFKIFLDVTAHSYPRELLSDPARSAMCSAP
jgi:RHO1 GDP-GTP exchange protein 1/2